MSTPTQFLKLRGDGQPARTQDNIDSTLRPIAEALNITPIMGNAPTWQPFPMDPAFASVTGQAAPSFYKDALMQVQTQGRMTTSAGVLAGATIGTFATGLRPKLPISRPVRGNGATYQSVTIAPTGVVTCDAAIAPGGTIDLGFSFLAEQ